jgi:hypothetical protein
MSEQLPKEIMEEVAARAYARGCNDMRSAVLKELCRLVGSMKPNTLRPGTIAHSIVEIVRIRPGLDSAALRERVTPAHPPSAIRQTMHYLRKKNLLEKHDGGWFRAL